MLLSSCQSLDDGIYACYPGCKSDYLLPGMAPLPLLVSVRSMQVTLVRGLLTAAMATSTSV